MIKGISVIKFIPAIVWFILAAILLTLPGSAFPQEAWMNQIIFFDKIVHIGLFSVLVFLFFIPFIKPAFPLPKKRKILLGIILSAFAFGVGMEFVQKYWVINRSFDIYDILADGIGSILPLIFFKPITSFRVKK